jgi:hypothetical protein
VGEWCALARPLLQTSPSVTRPGAIVFDGPVEAFKDGRSWPIGTAQEVNWIVNRTTEGPSITVAIPPVFEAYATFYEPDGVAIFAHEQAVVNRLVEFTPDQLWWLGYLDTRCPQRGLR